MACKPDALRYTSGPGVTVRELVAAIERVYGTRLPVQDAPPRTDEAVGAYGAVDLATPLLGWKAELTLDDAIASALAWSEKRKSVLSYE